MDKNVAETIVKRGFLSTKCFAFARIVWMVPWWVFTTLYCHHDNGNYFQPNEKKNARLAAFHQTQKANQVYFAIEISVVINFPSIYIVTSVSSAHVIKNELLEQTKWNVCVCVFSHWIIEQENTWVTIQLCVREMSK